MEAVVMEAGQTDAAWAMVPLKYQPCTTMKSPVMKERKWCFIVSFHTLTVITNLYPCFSFMEFTFKKEIIFCLPHAHTYRNLHICKHTERQGPNCLLETESQNQVRNQRMTQKNKTTQKKVSYYRVELETKPARGFQEYLQASLRSKNLQEL